MAEPGPVDAPCDLGAWRELYAKLNVPWRDPATGAGESAPRRSTPAFAPPGRKGGKGRPGMTNHRGEPVRRLEGPLRWVVDVGRGTSVAIAGPLPPPA